MNATRDHSFELVGAETLECELNQVRVAAAGSLAGIFGPRSMTWRVDREAAIFLGAGRALLLQLAHRPSPTGPKKQSGIRSGRFMLLGEPCG